MSMKLALDRSQQDAAAQEQMMAQFATVMHIIAALLTVISSQYSNSAHFWLLVLQLLCHPAMLIHLDMHACDWSLPRLLSIHMTEPACHCREDSCDLSGDCVAYCSSRWIVHDHLFHLEGDDTASSSTIHSCS